MKAEEIRAVVPASLRAIAPAIWTPATSGRIARCALSSSLIPWTG